MEEETSATIEEIDEDLELELSVTFRPPLYEQRRAWILNELRRKQISTILDVGCGEGALLACLCNPALYITRSSYAPKTSSSSHDHGPETLETDNESEDFPELHITNLAGLDSSLSELQYAIESTKPSDASTNNYGILPRWEELNVKIWHGGLEFANDEFVATECIVASEVIEHLPPDIFNSFSTILLGHYRPKYLLITTPSYTFNARFTAPDAESTSTGYLDPTGRTQRIFRHSDHKFEWTVDEFRAWCTETAETYGYDVDIGGIGKPIEEDPWGRDHELSYATQVAAFTRKEGTNTRPQSLTHPANPHDLLVIYQYSAHPSAGQPQATKAIRETVIEIMSSFRVSEGWTVSELWMEDKVSEMCGGVIDALIEAIESSEYLVIEKSSGGWLKWLVKLTEDAVSTFNISTEPESENLWAVQEDSSENHAVWDEEFYNDEPEVQRLWTPSDDNSNAGYWVIDTEVWNNLDGSLGSWRT